jgi:hypothetical protein
LPAKPRRRARMPQICRHLGSDAAADISRRPKRHVALRIWRRLAWPAPHRISQRLASLVLRRISLRLGSREAAGMSQLPALRVRAAPSRMSAAAARKAAALPSTSAAAVVRTAEAELRRMAAGAARKAGVAAVRMAGVAMAAAKASIDANPGLNPALTALEQSRATDALMWKRAPQRRRNRTVVARNHSSRPEPLS